MISGGVVASLVGAFKERALIEPMKAVAREPDAMNRPLQQHKNTSLSAGLSIKCTWQPSPTRPVNPLCTFNHV